MSLSLILLSLDHSSLHSVSRVPHDTVRSSELVKFRARWRAALALPVMRSMRIASAGRAAGAHSVASH